MLVNIIPGGSLANQEHGLAPSPWGEGWGEGDFSLSSKDHRLTKSTDWLPLLGERVGVRETGLMKWRLGCENP